MDDTDHHHHHDSEDINEWQQIEQHPSPETSSTTLQQQGIGWNIVVNENYLRVPVDQSSSTDDPPIHHQEGSSETVSTTTTTMTETEDGTSSPSAEGEATMAAALPPPSDWRLRVAKEGRKLLKLRLEAARNSVVRVASKVRECGVCAGAFWSVTCVAGAAAVLVAVVYVGIRRRRRRVDHRQSVEHLVSLLREKDEKISQLLLQIAQLNEVLSSRRKVPVLRISS